MDTDRHELTARNGNSLFDRVVIILEQARTNVVRTVNSEMVLAYWHIGLEIVQELQKGENRAEYDKQIIKELSVKLNEKYDKGFSSTNLWYFRQFYVVCSNREPRFAARLVENCSRRMLIVRCLCNDRVNDGHEE